MTLEKDDSKDTDIHVYDDDGSLLETISGDSIDLIDGIPDPNEDEAELDLEAAFKEEIERLDQRPDGQQEFVPEESVPPAPAQNDQMTQMQQTIAQLQTQLAEQNNKYAKFELSGKLSSAEAAKTAADKKLEDHRKRIELATKDSYSQDAAVREKAIQWKVQHEHKLYQYMMDAQNASNEYDKVKADYDKPPEATVNNQVPGGNIPQAAQELLSANPFLIDEVQGESQEQKNARTMGAALEQVAMATGKNMDTSVYLDIINQVKQSFPNVHVNIPSHWSPPAQNTQRPAGSPTSNKGKSTKPSKGQSMDKLERDLARRMGLSAEEIKITQEMKRLEKSRSKK